MKKLPLVALVLLASSVGAQTPPLSQDAVSAFYNVHLCTPPEAPPGFTLAPLQSRRFVPTTITYKVQQSGAGYVSTVRGVMAKVAAKMVGVQVLTEVPWNSPATIVWRIGSSTVSMGQTVPLSNGCRYNPTSFAGGSDLRQVLTAEVVCKSASQLSENLGMHEMWWHGYLTYCDLGTGWTYHATGPGGPAYEGVPGHQELARWLQTVPAGSVPPQ